MKNARPDMIAKRRCMVPIGDAKDIQKLGPSPDLQVVVACIDLPLALAKSIMHLRFDNFYTDIDGKVYTETSVFNGRGTEADVLRWASPEEFFELSDLIHDLSKSAVVGKVRAAVLQGTIKPELDGKPKKHRRFQFSIW